MRVRGTGLTLFTLLLTSATTAVAAPPINRVNVMPDRQVRPGVSLPVFGSADGGTGAHNADGSKYKWEFTFNPTFVSMSPAGDLPLTNLTNDRFISVNKTFTLLGGVTRQSVTATLTVVGSDNSTRAASVQIDIVSNTDPISNTPLGQLAVDTNITIENALRAAYQFQTVSNGGWDQNSNNTAFVGNINDCATTAINVWAFSNSGHRPTNGTADIYAPWVQKGIDFILSMSSLVTVSSLNTNLFARVGAQAVDGNGNGRAIALCSTGSPEGYASPMAAAAIEAAYSANPALLHATGQLANNSYFTIIQDAVDWISYTQMEGGGTGGCGPSDARGGWRYSVSNCDGADTSVESWNYVALEGFEEIFGGTVNENVKREIEIRLDTSEFDGNGTLGNSTYGRFGYNSDTSFVGGFDQAKTGGGLSGLAFVSKNGRVGYYLDPAGPGANTPTLRNSGGPNNTRGSFGDIAHRKTAAQRHLGFAWDQDACCSWGGNRGNFYSMWTQARSLRLNGVTQLFSAKYGAGGTLFDWQTGEKTTAQGQVPGAGDPLEGYFNYLVRTQQGDGSWASSTFNGNYTRNMNTAWGILILQPKVFPAAGNCTQAGATLVNPMYPLDHGLRQVNITGVRAGVTIEQICQDEDPNFERIPEYAVDGAGLGTATALVRAERSGTRTAPGNGRVYTIKFSSPELQCLGTVKIGVPLTATGNAVDDGPSWNSSTGARDCVIGATGPRVTAAAANGTGGPSPVDRVTLTFSEVIDPNSFSLADVVTLTGPSGAISPSSINMVDATHFAVVFPQQTVPGSYSVTVGPLIADLIGNTMDQNGNSLNGEVPGDRFTTSFTIANPPAITNVNPNSAQQGAVNLPVTISGNFTHFSLGSIVTFGAAGMTAGSPTAATATSVTVPVSIADPTPIGLTSVTVFTGGETVSLNNAFNVLAGTPIITRLSKTSAQQGDANVALTITGRFTHFNNSSIVSFSGTGIIVVGPPSAVTPLSLTVPITLADDTPLGLQGIQVVTGAEVVSLANAFNVLAGTPIITLINPNSGQQGQQNESVAITGRFTHWVNGTTTASFGAGVTASLTVNSPTSATAMVNIDPSAAVGPRNVTLTTNAEVVTAANGFSVTPGTPVLTLANPNSGSQGQTNEFVTLTGQYTHFQQGVTTASFGAGITVAQLTVNSATTATAKLNINPTATIGFRNVQVTTGGEAVGLTNGFQVTPGVPIITQVNPNTGKQNQQNEVVNITGLFTHFLQGVTTASFGAGITVNSLTVNSDTTAMASITIDPAAALGLRNVTLTTNSEVATMADAFTVQPGLPVLTLVNPNSRQQGQANQVINVTGQYTNFVQGTTFASFGTGVTIVNISVGSPTTAAVTVTIANNAPLGTRAVTMTTGAEVATLANAFTVNPGTPTITLVSPASGQQGATNLPVTITGQFTHFDNTSAVTFSGGGVSAGAPTAATSTSITVPVTINGLATLGQRDLQVVTSGETVSLANAFNVVSPGTPIITLVNPNVGHQSQANRNIAITGQNTHWVQNDTAASFGTGVTINSVTVADLTHATVNISIADDAPLGGHDVTMTTGSEVVTLGGGFTVNSLSAVATIQLALSQNIVNASDEFTYTVNMFDALNNPVTPPDPPDCAIVAGAGTTGSTPTLPGSSTVHTFSDTRGGFNVLCAPHAVSSPNASQSFVVVDPPELDGNGNLVPSQAGMFTGFSKSVTDAQNALAAIQTALTNGSLSDIPGLAAQLEAARSSNDYQLLRASVPFAPENGFPLTPGELTGRGFPPGPGDNSFFNDASQLINAVQQATTFLKGLDMAVLTDAQFAQVQANNAAISALATQFAGRTPTLNGIVSASGRIDVLLAQTIPTYFDTLATKLQQSLHVNGLALNNLGPAGAYLALAGPNPWGGSPAGFYDTARPAFIGLLIGMIGEGNFACQMINKLYGDAFKYIENAAILMAGADLLKGYQNFAGIDFIDTGGDPFSGFYFFHVPGSLIEGTGFNSFPSLNQVWLIGPNQINAARDVLDLFSNLPTPPNWKSLKEVWKFFEDVYKKIKDAVAAGNNAVDAAKQTDQPPDGFSPFGLCVLSDPCQDIIWSNGFNSVYSQGLIPAPVIVVYKNLENGSFQVLTVNFFSAP